MTKPDEDEVRIRKYLMGLTKKQLVDKLLQKWTVIDYRKFLTQNKSSG